MKVQYTIPGWEPAGASARTGPADPASAFETRLRESSATVPPSWREVLGLGSVRVGELSLAPPPRPATLAYVDVDEERRMWHGLLERHAGPSRLMALLEEMREAEDAVAARALVEARG